MPSPSSPPLEQLLRQRYWLQDSWTWLLQSRVFAGREAPDRRPTALDVGCGPGLVMELLSPLMDVQGVDIDSEAVEAANARGQRALVGRGEDLPFDDGSFDIVYCSFLLLWTPDPVEVLREMTRVSRDWVICLAEPDHRARVSHPPEVAAVDEAFVSGLRGQGADPEMGRKLPGAFAACGLEPEVGVHAGMWSADRVRGEAEDEWRSLAPFLEGAGRGAQLAKAKRAWDEAARSGSLVQFTPIFFALARKSMAR